MKKINFFSIVFILLTLLSAAFFFILFSSVRCESDDMIMALHFRENSLLKILSNRYYEESFRPLYPIISFFATGYSSNTDFYPYTMFAYYLVIWNLFVFAIYKLLKEIFTLTKNIFLICFAQLFFTSIYFLTTERIEIFGWASAAIIHLTPVVFIFVSARLLIKKQSKWIDYLLLFVASFFITSGAEHIAVAVIVNSAVLGFMVWRANKNKEGFYSENKKVIQKSIFVVVVTILFFSFFITNPGLRFRYDRAYQYTVQHTETYHINFLETVKVFCKPYKLAGLLFLFVTCVLFQKLFLREMKINIKLNYFLISFIITSIVCAAVCIKVYNTLNMDRVWFIADVSFCLLFAAACIKYSSRLNFTILPLKAAAILLIGMMLIHDVRHVPALIRFSTKHDEIVQSLKTKPENELVVVPEFPKPDLTNQVELSIDPDNGENQLFCRFYKIKAKVSVKK